MRSSDESPIKLSYRFPRLWHVAGWVVAAAAALSFAPTGAKACVYVPVTFVGTKAAEARWKKQTAQRRLSAARVQRRKFRRGVRAGKIDSADELAKLLIPNVREWYADRTNCGPGGDGDGPPVPTDDWLAAAFDGTELEGLPADTLSNLVPAFRRAHLFDYHLQCNTEFRARFTERLRLSISKRELDSALLLLSNNGSRLGGYFRFADVRRMTQPRAAALPQWAARVLADSQHPVTRALEGFWADAIPQLGSPALTCREAYSHFAKEREVELKRLRQRKSYPHYLKQAAQARGER